MPRGSGIVPWLMRWYLKRHVSGMFDCKRIEIREPLPVTYPKFAESTCQKYLLQECYLLFVLLCYLYVIWFILWDITWFIIIIIHY